MVRPERKLTKVTVKVFRADMNVRRVDRVLEKFPERLDAVCGIGGSGLMIGPSPFLAAMIDCAVNVSVTLE